MQQHAIEEAEILRKERKLHVARPRSPMKKEVHAEHKSYEEKDLSQIKKNMRINFLDVKQGYHRMAMRRQQTWTMCKDPRKAILAKTQRFKECVCC